MEIKLFHPDDMQACTALFSSAYNAMPWNYKWTPARATQYLNEYVQCPNFLGFVLWDVGAIKAGLFAHTRTWWTCNQLFIDELFVGAENQGKGYGRSLMKYAESYCATHGVEMITLMTNKFMPALKFYESMDYVKVDQFAFMFRQVEEQDED